MSTLYFILSQSILRRYQKLKGHIVGDLLSNKLDREWKEAAVFWWKMSLHCSSLARAATKHKIYRLILQVSLSGFELMTSTLFRTRRLTASLLDCLVIHCCAFMSTRCCSEVRNSWVAQIMSILDETLKIVPRDTQLWAHPPRQAPTHSAGPLCWTDKSHVL